MYYIRNGHDLYPRSPQGQRLIRARNMSIEDEHQITRVEIAVFHTILLHRTTGKYTYSSIQSSTFSVGTVGTEDIDCSTVDFTYVRCSSPELDQWLYQQIDGFSSSLCNQQGPDQCGKLKLEFYECKKGRWLLPAETVNWEVWNLQLDINHPHTDHDWDEHQEQLVETLGETVQFIADMVNRPDYIPRNPPAESIGNVFDTKYLAIQPFLHRVTFELSGDSVAGTVRKFIRDTFAYNY